MAGYAVAATGVLILVIMSIGANRKFRDRARLPMQWSFDQKVNWSAPRHLALAFTPLLAAMVMALIANQLASDPPLQFWTLTVVAAVFVAVHLLHLYLLEKWPAI